MPAFRDIWFFLLCTGCRLEEMVELRREAVDLKKKAIRIQAYDDWEPKTENSIRTIPIQDELADILKRIMDSHRFNNIFVTQDGTSRRNNLLRSFKSSMKAALYSLRGIPTRKHLTKEERLKWFSDMEEVKKDLAKLDIHSLRYTFITELISAGVNPKAVQYLAGHSDIQTTLNIYAQCRPEPVQQAIEKLPWKPFVTNSSQNSKS
ncbi:MAG: site-specific integrase [Planctomycetes bacterium]|nr:site-specific integrase [Planctomycetota bacterium]